LWDGTSNTSNPITNNNIDLVNGNSPSSAKFKYYIDNSYKFSFYIRGSSNGRFYNDGAYSMVTVIVCGGETL
jgi:hypothetical protein